MRIHDLHELERCQWRVLGALRAVDGSTGLTLRAALQALVAQLLQTQLSPDVPSVAARQFPNADWRYHITAQQEGGGL